HHEPAKHVSPSRESAGRLRHDHASPHRADVLSLPAAQQQPDHSGPVPDGAGVEVKRTAWRHRRGGARGQVLPVFALFLIVLFGMAALAIDVSGALSARRFYRSAADAAALAGGQDLQQGTSRTVTGAERTSARRDAMARLVSLLTAS